MNKTLLLIICDFLLLNLLALTRWEKAEPTRPEPQPVTARSPAADARTQDQDLVDVMKMSLEDERAAREQLATQLQSAQTSLSEREENLARLEAEKQQLGSTLEQTQQGAAQLKQQFEAAAREASTSKERLSQLQRDLEQREAEARRQAEQLSSLEKQQTEARERIEKLNVAVQVAEQEKTMLKETAATYRQQAESERQERLKVAETTTTLAQGVGQLAEKSAEITKEMRENRPINANTLFNDFLANRVQTRFTATRPGFMGATKRTADARTILVTDGQATYALLHVDDTPFRFIEPYLDWEQISVSFSKGEYGTMGPEIRFLGVDPRVIAIPVDAAQVASLGARVYKTAIDPFKFSDAVLISNGGTGYGEVPFKLEPQNPSYVRMDNRLVRRLAGNFSPSRGDLVLSKTGELLGIMVSSSYCAIVGNFEPSKTLQTGDTTGQDTSAMFAQLAGRVRRLPMRMQ